jgi:ferrous iron transport protein A
MSISRALCKTVSIRKCELIAFTSAVLKPHTSGRDSYRSAHPNHPSARRTSARGRRVVAGLAEEAGFEDGRGSGAIVLARLRDLGFVAGARCEVVAKMWPVGDPMVVRVGGSTFALRRTEAAAVRVARLEQKPAADASLAAKDTSAALA